MELITRPIERRLWPRGQRTTEPLPRWLVPARFTYALLRDLGHGDLSLRAMSLVYTTMLAIVSPHRGCPFVKCPHSTHHRTCSRALVSVS